MGKNNLKRLFDHYNKDGSGFLEQREIQKLLSNLAQIDPSLQIDQNTINEWTRLADLNKDNQLSYYDFCTMLSKYLVPNDEVRRNLRQQFYSYDMNNNGLMEENEFQNFMKSVYSYMNDSRFQYNDEMANTFFRDLDDDSSGTISFDEYYLYVNGVLRKD